MDNLPGIWSRTRSKRNSAILWPCLQDGSSSTGQTSNSVPQKTKRRRRAEENAPISISSSRSEGSMENLEFASHSSLFSSERENDPEPDFVFLGENLNEGEIEMIVLSDNDHDGTDTKHSEKKELHRAVDVKEEEKNDECEHKVENFGNVGYGGGPENPITNVSDGDGETEEENNDSEYGLSSSTETEDNETSDEDFQVDIDDEEERFNSDDSSSSSYCDEDDEKEKVRRRYKKMGRKIESESSGVCRKDTKRNSNQVKEEVEVEEEVFENTTPFSVENIAEKHEELIDADRAGVAAEFEMLNSPSELHRKKIEKVQETKGAMFNSSSELHRKKTEKVRESMGVMLNNSSELHRKEIEKVQESKRVMLSSSSEVHKKKAEKAQETKGVTLNSSSELHRKKAEKAQETMGVKTEVENAEAFSDDSSCSKPSKGEAFKDNKKKQSSFRGHPSVSMKKERVDSVEGECVNLDATEGKDQNDKGTSMRNVSSSIRNRGKIRDSADLKFNLPKKEIEYKDGVHIIDVDINDGEKKGWMDDESLRELYKVLRMPSRRKDKRLIKLLAECLYAKHNSSDDVLNRLEEKNEDVHHNDTQPRARVEVFPLKWSFSEPEEPIEKTESEKELDKLWDEMERALRFEEIDSQVGNIRTSETSQNKGSSASACEHQYYLDEEIGIYCRVCGEVATDIKYVTPPFADKFPGEGSGKRRSSDRVNPSLFDEAQLNDSGDDDSEAVCHHKEGTVWDLIPEVKQSLYSHQQQGLEFMWKNMAGTIDLDALKRVDPHTAGGCIISHAAGTGKTRLTIMFLQSYLHMFPKCLPVILAPANLLLNWEDEFKKWDIGVPFHNLNNLDLSGKEHMNAVNRIEWSKSPNQNKDGIRMVKLYSWFKEKSILGISYSLYEKLAGGESKLEVGKKRNRNMEKEKKHEENGGCKVMGDFLRNKPGLLVLDEGHTPRNQRSFIWKLLSRIQAQKRIILSGTPFQNNFLELYNILCLVKTSFPESIPQELKKFCQKTIRQRKKASVNWEPGFLENTTDERINQLKLLMDPFVHVHKGSILQKKLPGLKDRVLTLKPNTLQKEILESIESTQNLLNFEHKLALASVHPSLFLCCALSEKEKSVINKDQLEKLKLNPYEGVKTKFLMEFVRLCDAVNEKVLVFSQFIDTLSLIMDQLKSAFNWSEGKEVLHMCGKMDFKQKQSLIHRFNDENSQAKIVLASIKSCSEGINLVGASRVVLMDVVWNPSVERQAIGRAYRLGQKKVVYTYHLLTDGTAECGKYRKQVEKDKWSELVFTATGNESCNLKSSAVTFEDEILDQMICHEKLKDMICECTAIGDRFQ